LERKFLARALGGRTEKSSRVRAPSLRRLEVTISRELGDWDCAGDGGGEEDRPGRGLVAVRKSLKVAAVTRDFPWQPGCMDYSM